MLQFLPRPLEAEGSKAVILSDITFLHYHRWMELHLVLHNQQRKWTEQFLVNVSILLLTQFLAFRIHWKTLKTVYGFFKNKLRLNRLSSHSFSSEPSWSSFRSFSASSCRTDFCVFRTATYISRSVRHDFSASRTWLSSFTWKRKLFNTFWMFLDPKLPSLQALCFSQNKSNRNECENIYKNDSEKGLWRNWTKGCQLKGPDSSNPWNIISESVAFICGQKRKTTEKLI